MSKDPAPDVLEIEQAKRNAAVAKARAQTTANALKQRLSPKTLAADAKETVLEKTGAVGDAARKRPGAVGAAAGVATLILFRKPVGRLLRLVVSSKAREARRERKEEAQRAKWEKQAAKVARKDEKRKAKEERAAAKELARDPERQQRVAEIKADSDKHAQPSMRAGLPEDVTHNATASGARTTSAKQE